MAGDDHDAGPSSHPAGAGLSSQEAAARLASHGPNRILQARGPHLLQRFAKQFASPLVYILLAGFAFQLGEWALTGTRGLPLEAIAIAAALLANAAIGTWQEHRSGAALDRLRAMAAPRARVRRDGVVSEVAAETIVPGDIVQLEAGDRLPADGILMSASSCLVDESLLTGESLPVEKGVGAEASAGTLLARGQALLEVTRTGAESAIGSLATLLGEIEVSKTPLERRLTRFGNKVALGVVGLGGALIALGLWSEGISALPDVTLFAVAIAVAAVPEELPAVLALTLALGVERMATRNALVRRLSAVEALGSVTVIACDKTGTLTENRLHVRKLLTDDEGMALRAMVLASEETDNDVGDPIDVAFARYAQERGVDAREERLRHPRIGHRPFDSAWKFARSTVKEEGAVVSYLKGAPEVILERSALAAAQREAWHARAEAEAAEGYRVLAVARAEGAHEEGVTFIGLASLWDAPRPEAASSVERADGAGIRVLMVTGDHPATARSVARAVGIPSSHALTGAQLDTMDDDALVAAARDVTIFARVSPRHKVRLVAALQASGEIVAMTGDGVNDAPALRKADVGVAMGHRGSDVAREAADLVLLDDDFGTITTAIEEGRVLYANIHKFMVFMFSTSLSLLLLVIVGAIGSRALDLRTPEGGLLLPVTAVQILWINLVADGPPSFAIGLDRDPGVMKDPPRPARAGLLDRRDAFWIASAALIKAGGGFVLIVGAPLLGYGLLAAQTACFAYEYVAQLVYAYPARRLVSRPRPNRMLAWVIGSLVALQAIILLAPPSRALLGAVAIDIPLLALVLASVGATWGLAEGITRLMVRAMPGRSALR